MEIDQTRWRGPIISPVINQLQKLPSSRTVSSSLVHRVMPHPGNSRDSILNYGEFRPEV